MKKFFIFIAFICCNCKSSQDTIINPLPIEDISKDRIEVDLSKEYQTIHSFGASDCWYVKYIGQWQDVDKKNKIADLLFSQDTLQNGQPKGIGLSLWRFNIGAGSYEQGNNSNIYRDWNREECFLNANGEYDWNKQAGARWFLNAAKSRGVLYTLGFSNSPPVYMTKSGRAFQNSGKEFNLKPDKIVDFSKFLITVSKHFKFDYLSPFNEPQNGWLPGSDGKLTQEGSPALNKDIYIVTKELDNQSQLNGYTGKIVIGEAGLINFLYERNESNQGDQIKTFFDQTSTMSLNGHSSVDKTISYHSYWSTCDNSVLVNTRKRLFETAKSIKGLQLWQTEFGVLGDVCGTLNARPRNIGIDYGLYIAKVIHHDLCIANVTSWQSWLAVSPNNYSDALVYINGPDNNYQEIDNAKKDGIIVESKQLWATGNFSRFIRPNMKRVQINMILDNTNYDSQSVMLSAYKDEVAKTIVIVGVNMSDVPVNLPLSGIKIKNSSLKTYITNDKWNLNNTITNSSKVLIRPKSITTWVGSYISQ